MNRFIAELRRRHVPQTAAVYAVAAWAAIQFADVVAPNLNWPQWVVTAVIVAAAVGLPVVLVLAWFLEWGPEGIHRTPDEATSGTPGAAPAPDHAAPWMTAVGVLVVLIGGAVGVAALLSGGDGGEATAPDAGGQPVMRGTSGGSRAPGEGVPEPPEAPMFDLGELDDIRAVSDSAMRAAMRGLEAAGVERAGRGAENRLTVFEPSPWLMGRPARWDPDEPLAISGIAMDSLGVLAVEIDGQVVAESEQPQPALNFTTRLMPRDPLPDSIAVTVRGVSGDRTQWYRIVHRPRP